MIRPQRWAFISGQTCFVSSLIEPAEIAGLIGYLASDVAAPVTGAAWAIDGGWTAR